LPIAKLISYRKRHFTHAFLARRGDQWRTVNHYVCHGVYPQQIDAEFALPLRAETVDGIDRRQQLTCIKRCLELP
jgi:hypothetical protein